MKTKACRMAVLHQKEHKIVSKKWLCSDSDNWLVGSLVVTSQTGAFEYVTSGYGKLNCGTVVLLAEWLQKWARQLCRAERTSPDLFYSKQSTPFLLQKNKKIHASIFFDILPKILQHVDRSSWGIHPLMFWLVDRLLYFLGHSCSDIVAYWICFGLDFFTSWKQGESHPCCCCGDRSQTC